MSSNHIYKITNIITGDFYIGKTTKSIQERFKRHERNSKTGTTYLYRAFRKYGISNFIIESIESTNKSSLNEREMYWISKLSPVYNMTSGGDGGDTSKSPNYINGMKTRDMKGSNNPMFGRSRPDTHKYLISAKDKMIAANRCPVMCEGVYYESVGAAEKMYPGIKIRTRLDSDNYPEFYRLRDKTKRQLSKN